MRKKTEKQKYTMILDSAGEKGGFLFSRTTHLLNKKFGDKLVKTGRAEVWESKRTVNLDGKEMSWSDYLIYRKKSR